MLDSAFLGDFRGGPIFLEPAEPEPSEPDFETEPLEPEPDDFETVRNRTEPELPALFVAKPGQVQGGDAQDLPKATSLEPVHTWQSRLR